MEVIDRTKGEVTKAEWIALILAIFGPDVAKEEMQDAGLATFQQIGKYSPGTDCL